MTSYMMDLTWLGQFYIITHSEVNLLLIICHLTYLTFLIKSCNQPFESTFWINLRNQLFQSIYIELAALQASNILRPQIYVRRKIYSYLSSYVWSI